MYINICFVRLSCLSNRLFCSGFALSRFCREYWLRTNYITSIRSCPKRTPGSTVLVWNLPATGWFNQLYSGTQQDMIRSDWRSANAPGEQLSLLKVDLLYHRVSPVTCNTKAHLFCCFRLWDQLQSLNKNNLSWWAWRYYVHLLQGSVTELTGRLHSLSVGRREIGNFDLRLSHQWWMFVCMQVAGSA